MATRVNAWPMAAHRATRTMDRLATASQLNRFSTRLARLHIEPMSKRMQVLILVLAALLVGLAFGLKSIAGHFLQPVATAPAKRDIAAGSFRPTAQQLTSIKIAPVVRMSFRS